MHLQFFWNIIKDTYIFIILAWLITAILLKHQRYYKTYLTVSAVIYILILLYVTLLGRTASMEYKMELSFLWEYRLALSGHTGWWAQIFDNIMLFVPMGWLWGGLRSGLREQRGGLLQERTKDSRTVENGTAGEKLKWLKAIIFGLCASLIIELCQLVFKLGLFEFDDILNNTVGMIAGDGVYLRLGRTGRGTLHNL